MREEEMHFAGRKDPTERTEAGVYFLVFVLYVCFMGENFILTHDGLFLTRHCQYWVEVKLQVGVTLAVCLLGRMTGSLRVINTAELREGGR